MKISIIGSGNVGGALAQNLIKAGHSVLIGARTPLSEKSKHLATKIGEDRFTSVARAVQQAEVVILTIPPNSIHMVMEEMGSLNLKIVIDATNSLKSKPEPYPTVYHAVKTIGKTDRIAKCFNSTGFENLLNPLYNGVRLDMFCAGDNLEAKAIARQLSLDLGFEKCYDFGGDDKVQLLEEYAKCWVNLAIIQGQGRNIGFKILTRT